MPVSSINAEIKSFFQDFKDATKKSREITSQNHSIARRASVAVCQYPVIISDRISAETAFTVTKALEAEFANFILAYTSLDSVSDTGDFTEYIAKFHNNIDRQAMGAAIDKADAEQMANVVGLTVALVKEGTITPSVMAIVSESMIKGNLQYLSQFNLTRLNEGGKSKGQTVTYTNTTSTSTTPDEKTASVNNNIKFKSSKIKMPKSVKSSDETAGFTPTEIKRYNQAAPTMIKITGSISKNGAIVNKDFHIGVKARLEPVDSSIMVSELAKGLANNNAFFNFFRATSSEIEWLRDFILNVDQMKDAATKAPTSNRYFNLIQSFKRRDKILRLLTGKGLIPVTSIVFTEEEAAILKAQYMVDIKNPSVARKLMQDYFLIAIGIVDEASETVQFMFDSDIDYSSYTLKSLAGATKSSDMESLLKILRR